MFEELDGPLAVDAMGRSRSARVPVAAGVVVGADVLGADVVGRVAGNVVEAGGVVALGVVLASGGGSL